MQATRQDVGEGGNAALTGAEVGGVAGDRGGDSSSHPDGSDGDGGGGFLYERSARHVLISRMIQRAATSGVFGVSMLEGAGSGGEEAQGGDKPSASRPGADEAAAENAATDKTGDVAPQKGAEAAATSPAEPAAAQPSSAVKGASEDEEPVAAVKQEPDQAQVEPGTEAAAQPRGSSPSTANVLPKGPAGVAALLPSAAVAGPVGAHAAGASANPPQPDGAAVSAPQGSLNAAALAQFLSTGGAAQAGLWPAGVSPQQAEAVQAALKQNPNQQVCAGPFC